MPRDTDGIECKTRDLAEQSISCRNCFKRHTVTTRLHPGFMLREIVIAGAHPIPYISSSCGDDLLCVLVCDIAHSLRALGCIWLYQGPSMQPGPAGPAAAPINGELL